MLRLQDYGLKMLAHSFGPLNLNLEGQDSLNEAWLPPQAFVQSKIKRLLILVVFTVVLLQYSQKWSRKTHKAQKAVQATDQPSITIFSSKASFKETMHDCLGGPFLMSLLAQKVACEQRPEQSNSCSSVCIKLITPASTS